jgi:hypothetical protein
MTWFNSFMADTYGVAYRAATGNVDPYTKQEIVDEEAAGQIAAGADPNTAQATAEADVTATLKTFTLGGDDRVGADPSQASFSIPSLRAELDTVHSATNDDGSGCGITNLAGCMPEIPSWVKWAAAGVIALGALYVLAPYVGLASNLTRRS